MANSPSSLSSGKASIQITSKAQSSEPLDFDRTSSSSEAVSTGSTSTLPSSSPSSREKKELTDYDIIADIIANATAAAAAKSGAYSSLSSGKASIAVDPRSRHSINGLLGSERSRSEPISIPIHDSTSKRQSTSSSSSSLKRSTLLFGSGLFGNKKKIEEDPAKKELKDAGIEIKEIKSTLGRLIVPKDVSDPMPQVKLELPQHARLNR